jgi:hypothetical protein
VLAAVFTANGSYASGQEFVDGMNPAVLIGAALVAVGAVAGFAIKRSPRAEPAEVPLLAACACASCWCAPPADASGTQDEDASPTGDIPILAGAT